MRQTQTFALDGTLLYKSPEILSIIEQ